MANSTAASNRDFCLRLLHAETEDEVIGLVIQFGYWEAPSAWKPYGDISNNRGIVGNQQSSPVAALVEKIVNSLDAILIAACYRRGIEPTGPTAPRTMQQAMEMFFGVRQGKIENLDARDRTRLAEHIQLVATGTRSNPNYLVIDDGEGQAPNKFRETFLSLLKDNKTKIPFVQGKYNMGGTGVLQFSGTNSFQLIVSRRQPDLPGASLVPDSNDWGFTLVRRLDPGPEQPQSTYVYLAPRDQILSFPGDPIPVRPGRYPAAYEQMLSAGTCIKLWNYKLPGKLKTLATLDLRFALERHLQDPVLPFRVSERRNYTAHYYDTTMSGLCAVLADSRSDIEPGFDTGSPLNVPGVGQVGLRIVVIQDEIDKEKYPSGVFFNVNGQLHGELGDDFIARRTKLDYIAESMIVMVDCTALPTRVREDLFLASRDRMRQCAERTALEQAVTDYIKDHPGLRELNARRRQARLGSTVHEEASSILQDLVRSDPTLASLFGQGRQLRVPTGPMPERENYIGRPFPTFFRLEREPRGGLVRKCPRNRSCRLAFETDAANDYFSRTNDQGHLESRGVPVLESVHLWNGRANLRYALPSTCNVGDRLRVEVTVSDISRVQPFQSAFVIEVEADSPPEPAGPPPSPPGSNLVGIPNIREVRRDQWLQHNFDEESALELKRGDDNSLDIFVNMDNLYLKNEITRRRTTEPETLNQWFKYGLSILAIGMLFRQRQSHQSGESGNESSDVVTDPTEDLAQIALVSKGLAVTIIPVIMQLSRERSRSMR